MKVALVVPRDAPGTHNFHQVPIGSLYTAGELRRKGVDVTFADLRIHSEYGPQVYADVARADLVVVFSTDYDLAQCYPSLRPAAECVRALRGAGARRIVCAGSHATADAGLTRTDTGCDGVVVGEFEFAIPELVQSLTLSGEPPVRWPHTGTRIATEAELATLGAPAYDLAPMNSYFSEGFVDDELDRVNSGLVLANRGCPFGCDFCYLFFGRRLRRRPVEATLAEVETMYHSYGIRHLFFLDYTFTLDNSWVNALCAGIIDRELEISWICQTRADCLDEQTLRLMKRAGCAGVWLGIESPDIDQRRYLSKERISFADIERAISLIRDCGVQVLAFVMVGLPNETEASLVSLNAWLDSSQVYYSLSTFQRRLGTPLAAGTDMAAVAERGWEYLDAQTKFLGESRLRRADIAEFFDYHDTSPNRVANVMRKRLASAQDR